MNDPKKILIIEDDIISAFALELCLKGNGFNVVGQSKSADNLTELCRAYQPDGILLDIMLEGELSGLDAAEILRREFDTPVLFVSALNDLATTRRIEQIPNSVLIRKPFNPQEIVDSLNEYIPHSES